MCWKVLLKSLAGVHRGGGKWGAGGRLPSRGESEGQPAQADFQKQGGKKWRGETTRRVHKGRILCIKETNP